MGDDNLQFLALYQFLHICINSRIPLGKRHFQKKCLCSFHTKFRDHSGTSDSLKVVDFRCQMQLLIQICLCHFRFQFFIAALPAQ